MNGWHRTGLDDANDAFLIKQALPVGPRFWFLGSLGSVFHSKFVYYNI
jgi:hypothetical protein